MNYKFKNKYEYRMYGFVPYNISEIQKGIQFGHAVVEYSLKNKDSVEYLKWAKIDKTFIILNGGTTNNNTSCLGSLNLLAKEFKTNKITISEFFEPDLGDQLTSFVFLVDERVFNISKYPNYIDYMKEDDGVSSLSEMEYYFSIFNTTNINVVKKILFLRKILKDKKLA